MDDTCFYSDFDRIGVSNRNKSILKKLNIDDIGVLLKYSKEDIDNMLFEHKLFGYESEFISFFEQVKIDVLCCEKVFRNREGMFCHDMKIEYVSLSKRAFNYLKSRNINYISEILEIDESSMNELIGIGKTTIEEVFNMKNYLPSIIKSKLVKNKKYDDLSIECLDIINDIQSKKDINGGKFFDVIYETLEDVILNKCNALERDLWYVKLSRNDCIKDVLKEIALQVIEDGGRGLSLEQICMEMPQKFNDSCIVNTILKSLEKYEQIYVEDNLYKIKYKSIYDYIDTFKKEHHRLILLDRLQGETLEEIGVKHNLTRERVRQIVASLLSKRPHVSEDKYMVAFTKYYFEKEQFQIAFDVEADVYNYLNICYTKGSLPLDECFDDIELTKKEIKGFEKAIYINYVCIGDEYVKAQRRDICEYVVKTFATEDITYEDFIKLYYSLIKDLRLSNDERFSIIGRGYENKLSASDYNLWKYGKKLRYYNLKAYDFGELITTLNLDKYKDLEISTLLLFRKHLDLMNAYDIRDEYELHNLLKKIIKDSNEYIKFHRMPNIEIGTADKNKQVMDLLMLTAPIENVELANRYEESYGVLAVTAHANHFREISVYLHDGIYKIDYFVPSCDVLEQLRQILVHDFYTIADAKIIIAQELPNLNKEAMNAFVLKKIGYKTYSSYIIKNIYTSATAYFRQFIVKTDSVDIKDISTEISNLPAFQSELAQLKLDYEIIEYLPSKYINFRCLAEKGITKNDLYDYCEFVSRNVKEGEYFTIHSIVRNGVKNDLNNLRFEYRFYASILSECRTLFQHRRIGRNKLFFNGTRTVCLSDFIKFIMFKSEKTSVDIYDLISILQVNYDISLEKHKIIELIKGTSLYYDKIYHKVYLNYSSYFDAVT